MLLAPKSKPVKFFIALSGDAPGALAKASLAELIPRLAAAARFAFTAWAAGPGIANLSDKL